MKKIKNIMEQLYLWFATPALQEMHQRSNISTTNIIQMMFGYVSNYDSQ